MTNSVDTVASRSALHGISDTGFVTDYRGIIVLSSYAPLGIPEDIGADFNWAIVADIDKSEVFSAANALRNEIIVIGLIILAIVVPLAYLLA